MWRLDLQTLGSKVSVEEVTAQGGVTAAFYTQYQFLDIPFTRGIYLRLWGVPKWGGVRRWWEIRGEEVVRIREWGGGERLGLSRWWKIREWEWGSESEGVRIKRWGTEVICTYCSVVRIRRGEAWFMILMLFKLKQFDVHTIVYTFRHSIMIYLHITQSFPVPEHLLHIVSDPLFSCV